MKKILIYTNGKDGVAYHRLIVPYMTLQDTYPNDYTVVFWNNLYKDYPAPEEFLEQVKKFDILVYSRTINPVLYQWLRENTNLRLVLDMDDYWKLNTQHPLYALYKQHNASVKMIECIKGADYVTTTTQLLANKIKTYNNNVYIFPNAVNFIPNKHKGEKIRFGLIGGSSHKPDLELLKGIANQLPKEILDKIQLVLCGFDKSVDANKQPVPYKPEHNIWCAWEQDLTNNYTTISDDYKEFLLKFVEGMDVQCNESYRRLWTKDIWNYSQLFDEVDVLLVPLVDNEFNSFKSPLKLAEAGAKGVAVIVSDVQPYKDYLQDGFNCLAINNRQKSKAWVKAITKIVKNPELIDTLATGLKTTCIKHFNLKEITEQRKEFLDKI